MLDAIAARGPELQIVTMGRSSGRSGTARSHQAVRDVPTAGDVALVPLVVLAHVDDGRTGLDQPFELVDRRVLRDLGAGAEHVPGDGEERHGVEAAYGQLRLCRVGGEHRDRRGGIEHEARLRREARARDGDADGPRDMAREVIRDGADVEELRIGCG